jgi:hypothetical protein
MPRCLHLEIAALDVLQAWKQAAAALLLTMPCLLLNVRLVPLAVSKSQVHLSIQSGDSLSMRLCHSALCRLQLPTQQPEHQQQQQCYSCPNREG